MTLRVLVALLALVLLTAIAGFAKEGEIRPFKRGSWQEILHAHAGRPTIVHFWGLTCGPCRVEMPQWGRLLRERADLNLVVIDADLIPNQVEDASDMLVKTGLAGAENWIFADPFTERLRFEIDPSWHGEIPRTVLIARDGKATLIEGVADSAQVRSWLDGQRQ
jgi:thiol-disulfide isomerase/thioredoxin